MIEEIRMTNFKCFSDIKLSLSGFNILAGANASGKSTVIQAILLAFATFLEKEDFVDASKALSVPIGSPQSLISQNPVNLEDSDFCLGITEGGVKADIKYSIDKLSPLKLAFYKDHLNLTSRLFYLNAERTGPRMSYPAGTDESLVSDGSNAAFLIDRADMQQRLIPEELCSVSASTKFSIQVEGWMNIILGDVNFSVNTDLTKAITDIRYGNALVDREVLPTMTGFGLSYILSVVTAGLWCSTLKDAILIIENPEAHLHPAAQSRMGKFLQMVSRTGTQVIIETHSEHIVDGARIQAAWLKCTEDMNVRFFDSKKGSVKITDISVDKNGELSMWPTGFFDQKGQDLRELLNVRRNNAGK